MKAHLIKIDTNRKTEPSQYYIIIDSENNRVQLSAVDYDTAYTFDLNCLEESFNNFNKTIQHLITGTKKKIVDAINNLI